MEVHDRGERRCGIVTFTVEGRTPEEVQRLLAERRVQVWTANVAYARIDLGARGLESMVRASVHVTTTSDEIDRTVGLVEAISRGRA